ncbi:MAG: outer membrane beta-barrel protein [Rikenellaceae bacterium]
MRRFVTIALMALILMVSGAELRGQTTGGVVRGTLSDLTDNQPIAGAVVEFTFVASPDSKRYCTSNSEGAFAMSGLDVGEYRIGVMFFGYSNVVKDFTFSGGELTLPHIKMSLSSTQIDEVVKEIKALRATQHGDTLSYTASSFKVAADADVEGLVEKMPGISIEDGTLTANGEEVKKIYVDGREFFGDDVTTALKSLPAEIVATIEVYDKLSDNAQMSGIDDGEGSKAINIVTHAHMRRGVFGKVYGGYGYEADAQEGSDKNKYLVGGSVNIFNNDSRITILGLANNVNQTNFSFEDIMDTSGSDSGSSDFMIKSQPGVTTAAAVGVNYSDYFGEDDKLKVQGSYFYNQTQTYNEESRDKWYLDSGNLDDVTTYKDTRNLNHRFTGRVDWEIDKKQKLMIRPTLSFQLNDPFNVVDGQRYGDTYVEDNGYLDGYRDISSVSDGYWSGYNASVSLNYRLRLNDKGRLVTVSGWYSVNDYTNEYETQDLTYSKTDGVWGSTPRYQYKESPSYKRNFNTTLMFSEPITKQLSFNLNYKYTNTYQESNKYTYSTDEYFANMEVDEDATTNSNTVTEIHKMGVGLRYHKGKTNFVVKGYYQNTSLESDVTKTTGSDSPARMFGDVTYFSMANIAFSKQSSMKIYLNSDVDNPTITKLQDIYNTGNYMSKGNPDLDPSYTNQLKVRYTHTDLERGSTMMVMLTLRNTVNYMGSHVVYNPEPFMVDGSDTTYEPLQYTLPVNMDNYWNIYSRMNYGFPVEFIRCNLNLGVGLSYSKVPSIVGGEVQSDGTIEGGEQTNTDKMGYRVYATLGSNISENVDFTLKWYGKYDASTSSSDLQTLEDDYLSHRLNMSMKFVLPRGFTFTTSGEYNQYVGITDDYSDQYLLCNLFVGKKVLNKNRGEVIVGVFDLFDDNSSFSHTVGTNYTQNLTNSVLGRYFSIQFIYNIRAFAKGASTNMSDYKSRK